MITLRMAHSFLPIQICFLQGPCRAAALVPCCPLRAPTLARRQQASRLRRVAVRAEEGQAEQNSSGGSADSLFASGSGKIDGALTFSKDTENFQDVFAFAGELPEVKQSLVVPEQRMAGHFMY